MLSEHDAKDGPVKDPSFASPFLSAGILLLRLLAVALLDRPPPGSTAVRDPHRRSGRSQGSANVRELAPGSINQCWR
jgi:hypothetical protein